MTMNILSVILIYYTSATGLILLIHRYHRHAFVGLAFVFLYIGIIGCYGNTIHYSLYFSFYWILPLYAINLVCHGYLNEQDNQEMPKKYQVKFHLRNGTLNMKNIRRGVSIIGSAGSGKTESVVFNFLKHFHTHGFCGVIHDYKNFEITEMAYPLFLNSKIPFHIISFDDIYSRVNPIAPRYMIDEESVNEISRVLLENLLEQKESVASGSSKFFNDAVEGLLGGLIWSTQNTVPFPI